ncbi:MAG: hypothetical protein Q8P57_04390 [Candidatus Pacearchaeota archaeon]|nr:hypothetical protein [Candidatus Pacearchaeota archaeon]
MASKKSGGSAFGGWAFLIGVILAVIFGLLGSLSTTMVWVLVVIGLIVGFLNISDTEVNAFLMSGAILIIASAFGGGALSVIPIIDRILMALMAIFVPAVIVVAVKHVFSMARN